MRPDEFDPLPDEPVSARARVTGGPPPRRGRHAARGGGGGLPPRLSINDAKRLRGRLLPAAVAIVLMLAGTGVLGGTYFLDSVKLTSDLAFPATTTVLYSDGSVLAKLGEVTRYELPYDEISEPVKQSIVASEDQTFWTNEGVDLGSVVRAAWNNFTGGATQGGSTITQQYARLAFDLDGVTYQRKAREAVLAWKMNQRSDQGTDPRGVPELRTVRAADVRHRGRRASLLRQDREQDRAARAAADLGRDHGTGGHGEAAVPRSRRS